MPPDVKGDRPAGVMKATLRAEHDKWASLKGMTTAEAKAEFVRLVNLQSNGGKATVSPDLEAGKRS